MRGSSFIGSYVLFVGIALTISEYYNSREIFRSYYDLKDYLKSLDEHPEVPALITEARASFNYGNKPLKKVQDRRTVNHHARVSQAGLEMRIEHRKLKEEAERKEREIQDAFGRKMKSNRWMKRHPNSRYVIQQEGFPWEYSFDG